MKIPAIFFYLASLCLGVSGLWAEKIVIKGSDTLGAKLVPQLAESFKAEYPDTSFEIASEGSSTGIAAIINKAADVGMSSREPKRTELTKARLEGVNLKEITVAYDGIAVIVNEKSPLTNLTREEVEAIFTGDVIDWGAVNESNAGPISVYTRNTASGTYTSFKDLAMRRRDYGPLSQKMAGNEQIASEVANNPNGIGYVGLAYIETPGVKVIPIDGHFPKTKSIESGNYPYARPLYYLVDGDAISPQAQAFIDFTLGVEGQRIVNSVHFIPVH